MPEELVRIKRVPHTYPGNDEEREKVGETPRVEEIGKEHACEMEVEENGKGGVKRGQESSSKQKKKAVQRSQSLEKSSTPKNN